MYNVMKTLYTITENNIVNEYAWQNGILSLLETLPILSEDKQQR